MGRPTNPPDIDRPGGGELRVGTTSIAGIQSGWAKTETAAILDLGAAVLALPRPSERG
jgi:hypothetical protein